MIKYPVLFVLVMALLLSGCSPGHDNRKDPENFDPFEAVVDGSLQGGESPDEDRIYEGTAEVVRYKCSHTGKISLVIKSDDSFIMTVTTPTLGDNCSEGSDFESAKIYGSVDITSDVMRFSKCNFNTIPPEGLGNYTLKKAAGGVSCFDTGADNKTEKWLSVTFNVKRVIDGKVIE